MASEQRPVRVPKYLAPFRGKSVIWITQQQLNRYNTVLATKNTEIKAQQKIVDTATYKILDLEVEKNAYWQAWIASGKTTPLNYQNYLNTVYKITAEKKKIQDAENKIKAIKKPINAQFLSEYQKTVGNSSSIIKTDATLKPPFSYKYNAPMVKSAYIGAGPQVDSTPNSALINSPGNFTNADKQAWKTTDGNGIAGAKGVIQMSSFLAQHTSITDASKKQANFSDDMYGFKFLYNPNSVSMTWGINTEVNTQMESMGLDKSVPLTAGLFNSTISFELLLNRIGDMAFLDEFGLKSDIKTVTNGTNYVTQRVPTNFNVTDVYPQEVNNEELAMIYKKGTMYDIEYLFRAVNGFNAQYNSSLNGLTADRGWLYALPIELHLGDGLRYLVRLTTLNVNHNMFNDRMVPILTTVTLTCTRYYDGPEQTYQGTKK